MIEAKKKADDFHALHVARRLRVGDEWDLRRFGRNTHRADGRSGVGSREKRRAIVVGAPVALRRTDGDERTPLRAVAKVVDRLWQAAPTGERVQVFTVSVSETTVSKSPRPGRHAVDELENGRSIRAG